MHLGRGSKFKAQCYDKVVCPNCLHSSCNSTWFVRAAAALTKSRKKYASWDTGHTYLLNIFCQYFTYKFGPALINLGIVFFLTFRTHIIQYTVCHYWKIGLHMLHICYEDQQHKLLTLSWELGLWLLWLQHILFLCYTTPHCNLYMYSSIYTMAYSQ